MFQILQKTKYPLNTFTATANLELSILYAVNFQSFAKNLILTLGKIENQLSVTES